MTTIRIANRWLTNLLIELPNRPIIQLDRKHRGALPERIWRALDGLSTNASASIEVSDEEVGAILKADARLRSTAGIIAMQRRYTGGKW